MRAGKAATALAIVFLLSTVATSRAQAQTLTVLHSFTGADGQLPYAGLVRDAAGNLYGTTTGGGASGNGNVFKLDTSGNETVLHSFTTSGGDGTSSYAGLVMDAAGNLYGTTTGGGASGYGTVFKIDPSGNETVLYSFTGYSDGDGANPYAGLIMDAAGNLYGTTSSGGASGYGAVFKIDASGNETVLHSFTNSDGAYPYGRLAIDKSGNLYGTSSSGSTSGTGTVFKLDASGNETVLHSFTHSDGAYSYSGLVMDATGNLYGTTYQGGVSGYGTVFKIDTSGNETVLHSFTYSDGANPYGDLVRDAAGNLYGTTVYGGASGYGTVFKIDTSGNETVLYSFSYSDGATPTAGLMMDAVGNLYGATYEGGASGYGTVFKLTFVSNPPSVTVSFSSPPSGQAGFFKTGQTPVVGSVSATDPSNVTAITCSDTLGGLTAGALTDGGTTTASESLSVSGDGVHNISCTATNGAGLTGAASGSANTASISIDTTPPTVTYSGNPGTYAVDEMVNIACGATDALSGIASTTCKNINGWAYGFGSGTHTYSANATDNAGNQGSGSTSFTVEATYAGLINLVNLFVTKSGVADAMVGKVLGAQAAAAVGNNALADGQLVSFINQVSAQSGKSITTAEAAILIQLAEALMN